MATILLSSQPFGEQAVGVAVETKPASSTVWPPTLTASWRNSRERSNHNVLRDCGTKDGGLSLRSKARGCLRRQRRRTRRPPVKSLSFLISQPKAGRPHDAAAATRRRGGANQPHRFLFFDRKSCVAPRRSQPTPVKLHHGWLSKILPSKDDLPWPPLHHLLKWSIHDIHDSRFPQRQIHDSLRGFFTGCHGSQIGGLNWPRQANKIGNGISSSLFYMVWSWWQQSCKHKIPEHASNLHKNENIRNMTHIDTNHTYPWNVDCVIAARNSALDFLRPGPSGAHRGTNHPCVGTLLEEGPRLPHGGCEKSTTWWLDMMTWSIISTHFELWMLFSFENSMWKWRTLES